MNKEQNFSALRRRIVVLLFFVGWNLLALEAQEAGRLFNEANDFFRQGMELQSTDPAASAELYRKAASRFERLIREGGIRNGGLYYNLGNAWFRLGELGPAILNYRRALLYTPHDLNVQQNLAYARSLCRDKFGGDESARGALRGILLFWHYDLSLNTRTQTFCLSFVLFWVLAALRLFRPGVAPRVLPGLCAVVALLMLGSLLVESRSVQNSTAGVITASEVVSRKGDADSYQPSFQEPLHSGVEFTVLERRTDWLQIRLPDERTCWIPVTAAELVQNSAQD